MGAVTAPDLYRCAISVDGITDLPAYALKEQYFVAHIAYLARYDSGKLSDTSPVNLADKIKASVLLVHGGQDWRIRIGRISIDGTGAQARREIGGRNLFR